MSGRAWVTPPGSAGRATGTSSEVVVGPGGVGVAAVFVPVSIEDLGSPLLLLAWELCLGRDAVAVKVMALCVGQETGIYARDRVDDLIVSKSKFPSLSGLEELMMMQL